MVKQCLSFFKLYFIVNNFEKQYLQYKYCQKVQHSHIEVRGFEDDSDRAEKHYFWPRLWLFLTPFLFPPEKKREEEKVNELAKIVIKGHTFLLDHDSEPMSRIKQARVQAEILYRTLWSLYINIKYNAIWLYLQYFVIICWNFSNCIDFDYITIIFSNNP